MIPEINLFEITLIRKKKTIAIQAKKKKQEKNTPGPGDKDGEYRNPQALNRSAHTPTKDQTFKKPYPKILTDLKQKTTQTQDSEKKKIENHLNFLGFRKIKDLAEEISHLAKREQQTIAEERRQSSKVR